MALGKTVTYTPFQETSFGYGTAEIATAHSGVFGNATDIVKVTIKHASGNWDASGHLSTPSVGTAIAVYHEDQSLWVCKGQRDDVDDVLDTLSFFPADKPQSRPHSATNTSGFQTVALKANQTNGTFADEQPPAIGNTLFTVKVYNGASVVSTNTVTFDPTEPATGNQRPFFSVVPPTEDLNTTAHDTVAGGLVNFGTISHGSDTENVRVKCAFRPYASTSNFTGTARGQFTGDTNIFIGDKKPVTPNADDGRFDFTGSVAEAQAFLDNVRYYNAGNQQTFDMYLTISDGIVGSEYTKTVFFSDAIIGVTDIADLHYVEDDNPANWDFGNLTFTNVQPDVTTYVATIDLDATGTSNTTGFTTATSVDTQTFSSGILTITETDFDTFKTALRNLRYVPASDYSGSFNMTVDFTFSNPTLGTTYSSTQQTVAITGQEVAEISNPTTTHSWAEDQPYDFNTGVYPQIIHGRNEQFDITFQMSDQSAGVLWRHGTSGFYRVATGGYKLSGSRDEVNVALDNLYFAPTTDYNTNFTISFTVQRTSGDLTHQTNSTGTFTMNATAIPEFTSTFPSVNWEANVSKLFDSGIIITDTAAEFGTLPAAGTTYTVDMRLRNQSGGTFTDAKLIATKTGILSSHSANAGTTYSMTGSRIALNENLLDLKMIPNPLYEGTPDFYVEYKITRNFDGLVFTNFSPSYRTTFTNPTIAPAFTLSTQTFDWNEDSITTFDPQFQITEKMTDNTDYTSANGYTVYSGSNYTVTMRSKYWDGSNSQELTSMRFNTSVPGSLTIIGDGTVSNPLVLTGTKTDVNAALQSLTMTPVTPDFLTSPASAGQFWFEAKIERLVDSVTHLNYSSAVANFNAGTDVPEYDLAWANMSYVEDIADQRPFAGISAINDGAGDLFTSTYTSTILLDSTAKGEFDAYIDDGYVAASYFTNFEIDFTGTKEKVNVAIRNAKFTPVADGNTAIGITYTQKRTIDTTTVTHANAVDVGDMAGIATPEFVYGSANQNIQYFVPDEYIQGVDTTGSESSVVSKITSNTLITLTPNRLALNLGEQYDRAITITDTAADSGGPSQYKIVFSGGTLFNVPNVALSTMDTGFLSKDDLHLVIDNLYVTGFSLANNNLPTRGHVNYNINSYPHQQYNANFTLHRRTYTGTEAQIGQGSLTYEARSGLRLWKNLYSNPYSYTDITNTATQLETEYYVDYENSTNQLRVAEDWVSASSDLQTQHAPDIHARIEAPSDATTFAGATSSIIGTLHESINGKHLFDVNDNFHIQQKATYSGAKWPTGPWFKPKEELNTAPAQIEVRLKAWTDWGVLLTSEILTLNSDTSNP